MEIQEQFKCFNWCTFDNVKIEIEVVELAVQLQPEKVADYSFLKNSGIAMELFSKQNKTVRK